MTRPQTERSDGFHRTPAEQEFHLRRLHPRFIAAMVRLNERGRTEQAQVVHTKYFQWLNRSLAG